VDCDNCVQRTDKSTFLIDQDVAIIVEPDEDQAPAGNPRHDKVVAHRLSWISHVKPLARDVYIIVFYRFRDVPNAANNYEIALERLLDFIESQSTRTGWKWGYRELRLVAYIEHHKRGNAEQGRCQRANGEEFPGRDHSKNFTPQCNIEANTCANPYWRRIVAYSEIDTFLQHWFDLWIQSNPLPDFLLSLDCK
jgi:hypothetical protein